MPIYIRVYIAVYMGSRSWYTVGMDVQLTAGDVKARDQDTVILFNWYPGISRHRYWD